MVELQTRVQKWFADCNDEDGVVARRDQTGMKRCIEHATATVIVWLVVLLRRLRLAEPGRDLISGDEGRFSPARSAVVKGLLSTKSARAKTRATTRDAVQRATTHSY